MSGPEGLRNSLLQRPIRLARPDVGAAELAAIGAVLETGQLTMGPKVAEFESLLAHACETTHAVAVSSGTAALHLAAIALGLGPGDEVVVPAYTFPATGNVVELLGARAVLADVDPDTFNLDLGALERALTPRTKAVLAVHLFGRPLDWAALETAVPDGVALVEDAAGALGARAQGRACGSLGAMGCLSFHPRKIVTTGEGGAVTTSDDALAESVRSSRHHGWSPSDRYDDMPRPGFNYRIPDVLCALGIPQLERLEELLAARERVAAGYEERLRDRRRPPRPWPATVTAGRRTSLRARPPRRRAGRLCARRGSSAQIGTYALHRLSAYADQGSFPGADRAFERALALPFHTGLSESELDRVAEALAARLTTTGEGSE